MTRVLEVENLRVSFPAVLGGTAVRIGVGGLGDSLRIWPLVGVPFF